MTAHTVLLCTILEMWSYLQKLYNTVNKLPSLFLSVSTTYSLNMQLTGNKCNIIHNRCWVCVCQLGFWACCAHIYQYFYVCGTYSHKELDPCTNMYMCVIGTLIIGLTIQVSVWSIHVSVSWSSMPAWMWHTHTVTLTRTLWGNM